MDRVPIESLLAEGGGSNLDAPPRRQLAEAHVIIGVDTTTGREFTVFGTPALEESFVMGKPVALRTLRVELSQQAGELEKLVALVKAVKGHPRGSSPDE